MRLLGSANVARAGAAATFAAALLLALPAGAPAATFDVTPGAADAADANPGDGACDDGAGSCPLRAAVMEANALAGPDVIDVPAGTVELTIPVTADDDSDGDLDLTDPVEIRGAGRAATVVEQTAADRVLAIAVPNFSGPVAVRGMTLTGGLVETATPDGGGGIRISNGGSVEIELERLRITGNVVEGPDSPIGGGIWVAATSSPDVRVIDSIVDGNRVTNDDPAAPATQSAAGGGIAATGGVASALAVVRSRITGNEVTSASPMLVNHAGGGLRASIGDLSLADSLVADNSAGRAGGLFVNLPAAGARIESSTFAGNEATDGSGGAVVAFGGGTLEISSSTLVGHTSPMSGRVALMNTGSTLDLDSVTISDGGVAGAAAALTGIAATFDLRRTILDHAGDLCAGTTSFNSLGDNVLREVDGDCNAAPGLGDQVAVDAQLAALADNGGPTPTMEPAPLSPAVDAVGNEPCPPPATDQRGVGRPGRGGGAACDVGAFERSALGLTLRASKRLRPGRRLVATARCAGTPCDLSARARVKLKGGGKRATLRAKPDPRALTLPAGQTRKLVFRLSKKQARKLRRRVSSSPKARKRSRAVFSAAGSYGQQSAGAGAKSRFKRR